MFRKLASCAAVLGLLGCSSAPYSAPVGPWSFRTPADAAAELRAAQAEVATVREALGDAAGELQWVRRRYDRDGVFQGWLVTESAKPAERGGICLLPTYFLAAGASPPPPARSYMFFAPRDPSSDCNSHEPIRNSFYAVSFEQALSDVTIFRDTIAGLQNRRARDSRFVCLQDVCNSLTRALAALSPELISSVARFEEAGRQVLLIELFEPEGDALNPHPRSWGVLRLEIETGEGGRVTLHRTGPPLH